MKLILIATIAALALSAVSPITAATEKYDGTLTCKLSIDVGAGAVNHTPGAASKLVFLYSTSETANTLTATSKGATCIIATEAAPTRRSLAAADTHTILAATTGTCSNYTASATPTIVVGTSWTASTYGFNCTAIAGAALNTVNCHIFFDMGSQPFELPASTSFKGGAHLQAVAETAADIAVAAAVADATYTAGTGDKACEDKSSATASAFAGAAALVGSALFF